MRLKIFKYSNFEVDTVVYEPPRKSLHMNRSLCISTIAKAGRAIAILFTIALLALADPQSALAQADLSLTKSVAPTSEFVGSNVTFTIVVDNAGPNRARGVMVEDILPAGLTYVSHTSQGGAYNPGTGVWNINNIRANRTRTLTITATVNVVGPITNSAEIIDSNQTDPDSTPDNNDPSEDDQDSATVTGLATTNDITGTIFNDTNGDATQNGGETDASGITVFLWDDPDMDGIGNNIIGTIDTDASGSYTFTVTTGDFVVTFDEADFPAGGTTTSPTSYAINFSTLGNVSTGNDFSYQSPIELSLTKSATPASAPVGQTVDFQIDVSNAGPGDASGVDVNDLLPAGVTFVSYIASSGTYDETTGSWTPATIPASGSATLTITATIDIVGDIDNTAEIMAADANDLVSTFGNGDPNEQDQDAATVTGEDTIDLSMTKAVDEPAPDQDETIVFTLEITNAGPSDGTGITATDVLPDSIAFTSFTSSDPTDTYDETTGLWTIGNLAVGETATLQITAVNEALITPMTNVTEVTSADQADFDSTPNNGDAGEDDYAEATVSPSGVSGGGGGGIESDGSAAQILAQVMFDRRRKAQLTGVTVSDDPTPFLGRGGGGLARNNSFEATLVDVIPTAGPAKSVPIEVSPEDLIPVTNAEDIVAVDYIRPDGRRIAAMYTALTVEGSIYEHTKVICDRLKGAQLDYVEIVSVRGRPFVLSKLMHTDGTVDYSISAVAYDAGGNYIVDSRFRLDEYDVPAAANLVFNIQAWSVSREYSIRLIEQSLAQLEAVKPITFLNEDDNAPELPQVYVRNSYYNEGQLIIDLYNRAGAGSVTLTSATLGRTERSPRELFEKTVAVPPANEHNISTVVADVGPLFDIAFFVQPEGELFMDQVYVADGSWGFAYDLEEAENARVDKFEVLAQDNFALGKVGLKSIERSVRLTGEIKTWAAIFRYLRPGGQSVDLTDHKYLEFEAWGEGQMRVLVEKASIKTSDHFSTVVKLPETKSRHRIWFEDLRLGDGTGKFTADDVVVVSFYVIGPQGRSQNVDLTIENLRFGGAEGDVLATVPETAELKPNYPNPFSRSTTIAYGVAQSGHVKLTVHDMLGRRIATLVEESQSEGRYEVEFDAADLASGMYLYRLETGNVVETKSMLIVR